MSEPTDPALLEARAEKIDSLAIELDVILVRLRGLDVPAPHLSPRAHADELRRWAETLRKHRAEKPPVCVNCKLSFVEEIHGHTVLWAHRCQPPQEVPPT